MVVEDADLSGLPIYPPVIDSLNHQVFIYHILDLRRQAQEPKNFTGSCHRTVTEPYECQ